MTNSFVIYVIFLLCFLPYVTPYLWQKQNAATVQLDEELQLPRSEAFYDVIPQDLNGPRTSRYLKASEPQTEPAYFSIRTIEHHFGEFSHMSPAEIHIKIHNPKPDPFWYSVTIVSHGVYSGSAKFLRRFEDRPGNPLIYSWTPVVRGDYEIVVHELARRVDRMTPTLPMEPYAFRVVDKSGCDSLEILTAKINRMPPCQTQGRRDLYTHWDGYWIGPALHQGLAGLRNGWYFFPSREFQCKFEYFTDRDLSMIPEEKSIYILGSSKERGIFLSLVDMLLDDHEKQEMNLSIIAKCWGRAMVTKSNMKVMYQDWRSNYFQHTDAPPDVLCHNDRIIKEGGTTYTENGLKVWQEIFQDASAWPNVILMSTGNDMGFRGGYDLHQFILSLPPTWDGMLFLTDGAFSPMHAGRGTDDEYKEYRQMIREMVWSLNDLRVRWIDGLGLSSGDRFYGEDGPNHITRSQHFHSHCDGLYEDETGQVKTMKICSNITEVVSQLLLGHALGSKEEFIEQSKIPHNQGNREAVYCHACPADLLPFHITPYPNMQCAAVPLRAMAANEVFHQGPQLCPYKCISEVPVSRIAQTQSGIVHERNCPLEYFI